MRARLTTSLVLMVMVFPALPAGAHCQIPCGIYGDEERFRLLEEHISTIAKSMQQIGALSEKEPIDHNQLVRWVQTKEDHAQKVQDILARYFLAQRIKAPGAADAAATAEYHRHLVLLHGITVAAMRAKQTTDLAHVETLRTLLGQFRMAYLGLTPE